MTRGGRAPWPPPGRFAWLALAVVAALALLAVPQPFCWDQAMFALGARSMAHGGVLYRDFWDAKQPGVFAFYHLGGALFGLSEFGVHALEAIWQTGLALLLIVGLRRTLRTAWGPGAAALLSVGWFYSIAGDWHLTQVEALVGLPMFLALLLADRAAARPAGGGRVALLVGSGLAGGVCLLLKLLFLPIVAWFWVAAAAAIARRDTGVTEASTARGGGRRAALVALGAAGLGCAVPLAATAAWFAAHGALDIAWWTTITFPLRIARSIHGPRPKVVLDGLGWFLANWTPVLALAAVGALGPWRGRDLMTRGLIGWLIAGGVVFVAQKISYWQYQYALFVVPLGVLAARGLETLEGAWRTLEPQAGRVSRAALVALALLCAPSLMGVGLRAAYLAHDELALTAKGRTRALDRGSRGSAYPRIRAELAFLREPGRREGPIYVLGNPIYYWLSGREQAIPRGGSSFMDVATPEEWADVAAALDRAAPPYVFVQADHDPMLADARAAAFADELATRYVEARRDAAGTWYERR